MTRTCAPSSPFSDPTDAGSGAGAGGGQGAGAGAAGAGSPGAGAGAGGSGGGSGAAPIAFTDDTLFTPPGSTTPVKWGDYSKQYIHADRVKAEQATFARTFLENLSKVAGKNRPQQHRQSQPAQPADAFADVRGLPLIDGATLAQLGERIQREGIGPLYEWAGKINGVLEQVGKRLQQTERGVGSFVEHRSRGEFEGKMQAAATALAKEMLPGVDITKHPVIHDFVQDVYLSYDPNDPTLEREFPGLLKTRIDGILKLAADLNQAKLVAARDKARGFLRSGGQGQPSGQGQPERLSHRDIARNLFAADASRT